MVFIDGFVLRVEARPNQPLTNSTRREITIKILTSPPKIVRNEARFNFPTTPKNRGSLPASRARFFMTGACRPDDQYPKNTFFSHFWAHTHQRPMTANLFDWVRLGWVGLGWVGLGWIETFLLHTNAYPVGESY